MKKWQQTRLKTIRLMLLTALGLIIASHFYYAVIKQKQLLKFGDKLAWRIAEIPPSRGRILDKNLQPIAWSERHYDLTIFCDKDSDIIKINNNIAKLRKILPKTSYIKNLKHALYYNLS